MLLKTNPKISIVLPTFNREMFLSSAIEAIIAQSEVEWELIVVNDNSTDGTRNIVEEYIKKDSRIILINNDVNKKLPASLNIGFRHARGKYFTWTSDDNLYHASALEKMSSYLDAHAETDMVVMNSVMVDENDNQVSEVKDYAHLYNHERSAPYLLFGNNVNAAFMYTRAIAEAVGGYDEKTFCAEDYDYWFRIALRGKIAYTDDIVYTYRFHSKSLTETAKDVIAPLTSKIVNKYADEMLERYYQKWIDKYKFVYNTRGIIHLRKHTFVSCLARISRFSLRLACSLIWSSKLRKKIRAAIKQWHETYSFTVMR